MKTVRFTMPAERVERGLAAQPEMVEEWGVVPWQADLKEGDPVEGVVVEWEIDGNEARLTVLMSDDHAARLAVSPESGEVDWNVEEPS